MKGNVFGAGVPSLLVAIALDITTGGVYYVEEDAEGEVDGAGGDKILFVECADQRPDEANTTGEKDEDPDDVETRASPFAAPNANVGEK